MSFSDGVTTISFGYETTGHLLRQWTPEVPSLETTGSESSLEDGGETYAASYRNPTETISVGWTGTLTQQRAALNSLNRLFQQARHRQRTGLGSRVYLLWEVTDDPGGYGAEGVYRSEVLSGRVLVDDSLRAGLQVVGEQLLSEIVVTRRFFWEGEEEQIPLTNGNAEDDLAGLTVWNHDDADAGHDNYVAIKAVDVLGDLPAPLRLKMENTYDDDYSNRRLAFLWISHNVHSSPGSLGHILEGEDCDVDEENSTVADPDASGGALQLCDWVGDVETEAYAWTLSSAVLAACGGNYFKLLALFGYGMDVRPIRFRWGLTYQGP